MNSFTRPRGRTPDFMRTFVSEYNQIIRTHTEMMMEYNRNIRDLIRIMGRFSDAPTPTPAPTPVTTTTNPDIAALISLLSQVNMYDSEPGLTREQIENATDNVLYTSAAFPEITQCPISLDDFIEGEVVCQIRHCRHIFKQRNIMRWFDRHTGCPVCRHELLDDGPAAPTALDTSTWSSLLNRAMDTSGNAVYTFEIPFRR